MDAVYMQATTSMTGHGGWPMTCVLDHDGNPFFAGTYFPDAPRHGQPSFRQVLEALTDAWHTRGDEVRRVAGQLREHLSSTTLATAGGPIDAGVLDAAVATLAREFDPRSAGFGGAPKFPPSMVLEFLLRHGERDMLGATLEAMARGGIHDQLGGGFARYSVDNDWVVPHFEKMLYDNALLMRVYAEWGTDLGERVADRHRRVPAPRAAHRPGRLRLRPRRRLRGRGGHLLRLDPGAAHRGPRSRGRPVGCRAAVRDRGRHLRTRRLDAAAAAGARDVRRAGALAARPAEAAVGTRTPGAARPRRQGRGGVERARDQRPVPRRHPLRPPGVRRGRGRRGRAALDGCTWSTAGCGGSRATVWSAHRPGCSRTTGAWRPGSSTCSRPPVRAVARARRHDPRHRPRALRRRRRRVLRHRRRRRGAGRPAAGPLRQRLPVRPVVDGARAVDVRRHHRCGPLPRRRRERAGDGRTARRAGAAVCRLVAGGRASRCSTVRSRSPSWVRRPRSGTRSRPSPGATRTPSWSSPTSRATTYPCWSDATPVDGQPAAYVCRNFVCERPVTTADELRAALAR